MSKKDIYENSQAQQQQGISFLKKIVERSVELSLVYRKKQFEITDQLTRTD